MQGQSSRREALEDQKASVVQEGGKKKNNKNKNKKNKNKNNQKA